MGKYKQFVIDRPCEGRDYQSGFCLLTQDVCAYDFKKKPCPCENKKIKNKEE